MAGLGDFFRAVGANIAPEVDQRRGMANAAIQQLSQVNSPQAQYWMQQLHANPGQALAAAEPFGGIGAVSQSLMAAQAQARAQQEVSEAARASGMSGLDFQALQKGGFAGLKQFREAQKIGAELNQIEQIAGMPKSQLVDFYARTDPSKAKALAEMWGMAGLSEEDVRSLKNDREKVASDYNALFRSYKSAKAADVNSPEWGQALTILFNQVLQPNSAVLEGEARATAASVQSMLEEMGLIKEGVFNPQTPLSTEGAKRILGMIEKLSATAMKDYESRHEGWARVNEDLGIEGKKDLFTRPGYERLDEIRETFSGAGTRSARSGTPVSVSSVEEAKALPPGTIVTAPNGYTFKILADGMVEEVE